MKKTDGTTTQLDGHLKQLDEDMVWDAERQSKLRYQILANLDKQETKVRFSRGFKAATSLMLCMICLFAGYLFISQNIGTENGGLSTGQESGQETIPAGTNDKESGHEDSAERIQAVIEEEFNGPDEKYKELLDAAMEAQISDEYMDDYEAYLKSPEHLALMNYMEETYASHFTEEGYEKFINVMPAFMYSGFEHNYTLTASDIKIEEIESRPLVYDLNFQVEYKNENNETSQHHFEGTAAVSEEGKIVNIEYLDGLEDGLLQKLRDDE
ncbi:hypothetical protein [Planococcus sp. CAU13]|uniref:hypothetical protein n=1 Tax=Planococcus sp. CAU13 TaxID=1541197 RepID=UPI000690DD57|nr:hypothetical protein [Planococcus sp. CAU13]